MTPEKRRSMLEPTQYGFRYGGAEVSRLHSDDLGNIWIEVKGAKGAVTVRVTPSGLVRVQGWEPRE